MKEDDGPTMSLQLLILLLISTLATASAWQGTSAREARLQGRAELSDRLTPLRLRLRPGSTFDSSLLPGPSTADQWLPVPKWFAGTWRTSEQTTLSAYDDRTATEYPSAKKALLNVVQTFGKQVDSQGNIWEFVPAGRLSETSTDETVTYTSLKSLEVLSSRERELIWRVDSLAVVVDRQSQKVIGVLQKEQLLTYRPAGDGLLEIYASTRAYDVNGDPYRTSRASCMAAQVSPFAPVAQLEGKDLAVSFRAYLKDTGRAELIP